LRILNTHYRHAGMGRDGRSHNFDFTVEGGKPLTCGRGGISEDLI
jgi:hypothetical protein